jgi:hypothetical protein
MFYIFRIILRGKRKEVKPGMHYTFVFKDTFYKRLLPKDSQWQKTTGQAFDACPVYRVLCRLHYGVAVEVGEGEAAGVVEVEVEVAAGVSVIVGEGVAVGGGGAGGVYTGKALVLPVTVAN